MKTQQWPTGNCARNERFLRDVSDATSDARRLYKLIHRVRCTKRCLRSGWMSTSGRFRVDCIHICSDTLETKGWLVTTLMGFPRARLRVQYDVKPCASSDGPSAAWSG